MNELSIRLNQVLREYVKPETYPIAVRIYKKGEKIPVKLDITQRDLNNNKITIYQAMSITRRYGWTLALDKETETCPVARIISEYNKNRNKKSAGAISVKAKNAAGKEEPSISKELESNLITMVFSPLDKAQFVPDLIIVYGDKEQVGKLIASALFEKGGSIEMQIIGDCSYRKEAIIPHINSRYYVIISKNGDNFLTFETGNELAFVLPFSKIQSLIRGITETRQNGTNGVYNSLFATNNVYKFLKSSEKLEKYCG